MKSSKKNIIVSAITVIALCFSLMIGGTYAWFTDEVSSSVCTVESGTLRVGLEMKNNAGEWEDANGKTLMFKVGGVIPAENTKILWEPGCTYELPELRIINNGNLALKYRVVINGIDGDNRLNEVIRWTVGGVNLNEYVKLLPEENHEFTIKGHMLETAGNVYQGLSIEGIGITVYATQASHEVDSKDNTYDIDATNPNVTFADTSDSLKEVLASDDIDGKTIKLTDNIAIPEDEPLVISGKDVAIDLNGNALTSNGKTFSVSGSTVVIKDSSSAANGEIATSDSYPAIEAVNSDVTIEGGKFTSSYAKEGSSGYANVIQARNSDLTINGGYFENTDSVGSYNYIIKVPCYSRTEKTTVTINGGTFVSNRDYGYIITSDSDADVDVIINGGTFKTLGRNSYLTNVKGNVIVNDCTFVAEGNNTVFNIPADSTVTVKGGTYSVNEKSYTDTSLAGLIFHRKTNGWTSVSGTLLVDPAEGKEVKVNQLTYAGFIAEGASQSAEKDADGYYVIKK